MRRVVAGVLIGVLVAPPASAGQKLAKPIEWQGLRIGMTVALTTREGPSTTERVLFVDESSLVTRKAALPILPKRVENVLLGVGSDWPAILDDGFTYRSGQVRLSRDGVFAGDKRLAALTDVVRRTPRVNVTMLAQAHYNPGPGGKILLGVLTVLVIVGIGVLLAISCSEGGPCDLPARK